MKSLAPACLLILACLAPCSYAAAPDPSLVGCWRAVKIVRYAPGGLKAEDTTGRCTLRFQEDQMESTCGTASGTVTSTYRYRIGRPHFYLATMSGSTFRTDLVGSTREYEYHVDGDRLATATHLQAAGAPVPSAGVRVETEAARMPCQ